MGLIFRPHRDRTCPSIKQCPIGANKSLVAVGLFMTVVLIELWVRTRTWGERKAKKMAETAG